jgi:hypothetical protein
MAVVNSGGPPQRARPPNARLSPSASSARLRESIVAATQVGAPVRGCPAAPVNEAGVSQKAPPTFNSLETFYVRPCCAAGVKLESFTRMPTGRREWNIEPSLPATSTMTR